MILWGVPVFPGTVEYGGILEEMIDYIDPEVSRQIKSPPIVHFYSPHLFILTLSSLSNFNEQFAFIETVHRCNVGGICALEENQNSLEPVAFLDCNDQIGVSSYFGDFASTFMFGSM